MKSANLGLLDQLLSIATRANGVFDGDLIGKPQRDELVRMGWVEKTRDGYNILTEKAQTVVDQYIRLGRIVRE